jgi:hypothetical protein
MLHSHHQLCFASCLRVLIAGASQYWLRQHETAKENPGNAPGLGLELTLCRSTSATGPLVSFVFCSALLHQITVLAHHRVSLEALLANFATTGVSVGGG